VRRITVEEIVVFPGVDEEAVEAAESSEEKCGGKQVQAEVGTAGYRGDESGCGEEEANGDLFGKAMGAGRGMDDDEVADDEDTEDEVKANGFGFEVRKKGCESDGGEDDCREKGVAVTMVEVVAGFEVLMMSGIDIQEAGVHEAVGGV
jgi:hypothetical protein